MSDEADFVDDLLMAGVDLNATDCRIIRDKLRAFLSRSTSSPPAPASKCKECSGYGFVPIIGDDFEQDSRPCLSCRPPAPVDPVEARRLRDDEDLGQTVWTILYTQRTSWLDAELATTAILDAIEAHLAHHTATSEPR